MQCAQCLICYLSDEVSQLTGVCTRKSMNNVGSGEQGKDGEEKVMAHFVLSNNR
jgi:hypothetical protein